MKTKEKQIRLGDFRLVRDFIEEVLTKKGITQTVISETMLISEALLYNMKEDGFDDDTILNISVPASLGDIRILIGFEGKRFPGIRSIMFSKI